MPVKIEQKKDPNKKANKTQTCIRCQRVKPLADFYSNRSWDAQCGCDAWCKACVQLCSSKEAMKEYFWENNRQWNEMLWLTCVEKAEDKASENTNFEKLNDNLKRSTIEQLACRLMPNLMNAASYYAYEDHSGKQSEAPTEEAKKSDRVPEYSQEFNGYFRKNELEYLQEYYAGLEQDFDLSDTNIRDIAKKLAKASLQADKAQNDYMSNRVDYSVVKDALAQFDLLSKTGNFAACKRKPGDNGGIGSWAEITLKLEQTGHPCTRKIEWEQDDVDTVLEEYRHIVESLSLDQV